MNAKELITKLRDMADHCESMGWAQERGVIAEAADLIERLQAEHDDIASHHDACIRELYRLLGIDGSDGEYRFKWAALEVAKMAEQLRAAQADAEAMRKAFRDLCSDSIGVAGLHKNGDVALWSDLRLGGYMEEWCRMFDEPSPGQPITDELRRLRELLTDVLNRCSADLHGGTYDNSAAIGRDLFERIAAALSTDAAKEVGS